MISILLFALAGVCKALSDAIAHGKIKYSGAWWDWEQGWKAKWKGGDPNKGEAFLFSSTLLVFLSDGWHFWNMVQYLCLTLALPAYVLSGPVVSLWVDVLMMALAFRVVFQICYSKVFSRAKV